MESISHKMAVFMNKNSLNTDVILNDCMPHTMTSF